jgi:hypothetical protein
MKRSSILLFLIGFFLAVNAQTPIFETGVYIYDGATPIDVGLYSSPVAYDWNGDAKKDLIVGQFDLGHIRYYENLGTHDDPVFTGFSYLQANSATITLPYG